MFSQRSARRSSLATAIPLLAGLMILTAVSVPERAFAQAPQLIRGRNVNMVAGTSWPDGDPYLQRQNEPSIAGSTRNPLHLLAGANDYRTVDIPNPTDGDAVTGDAWLGIFKSFDGGQRWKTTLLPGYPQDVSALGLASPLKGYQAAADPVVRPGTNGLFYYSGIVFDRAENGRSALFVARFIDNNNKENGDPIAYLGASLVTTNAGGTSGAFIDKPWMAVDVPRTGARTCVIPVPGGTANQRIRAGNVYVAYSLISGAGASLRSTIMFTTSTDCGNNWSKPIAISSPADPVNQGATIAIDPQSGAVNVAWRVFGLSGEPDAMMVARSSGPGRPFQALKKVRYFIADHSDRDVEQWLKHEKKEREGEGRDGDERPRAESVQDKKSNEREQEENRKQRESNRRKSRTTLAVATSPATTFDQATQDVNDPLALAFRTSAYPAMAIDGSGRIYLAWSERGFAGAQPGDARIVITTSLDAVNWTARRVVEEPLVETPTAPGFGSPRPGHQIMPSMTFGGGRIVLLYYDLRDDASQFFGEYIDDKSAALSGSPLRHTLDLRASFGAPGATPVFDRSIRISDYLSVMRRTPDGTLYGVQAQFNAPNLPMFKKGTAPFMGDYVDVALAPAFVPTANGGWAFNTNGAQPVFHAVWTDNRDVRQPALGTNGKPDWTKYTPPVGIVGGSSRFDPAQPRPVCDPRLSGSRNQNIYTARLSVGLVVGSPGNTKPLSTTLQRAFVVFAQNTGAVKKVFRMTIGGQPVGGRASFDQFSAVPLKSIDVTIPPRSMASRSVYVTSSDPMAQVRVSVTEVASVGCSGTGCVGTLSDVVVLNPDIANPDIANPDIANPDIANPDIANPDIANKEVYNPDIANPDIANPDIANPDIANPDIANPDIANPDIANPDIANPDIANPDIANPDIANPDIANVQVANPDIANPDIANPDIANPDIANPDIANPDIANPDIANPDIANPDIANASLTDVTWTMTNNGNTTAAFNVNLFLAKQTSKICAPDATQSSTSDPDCLTTQLVVRKVYSTPMTGGAQNGVANGCSVQVQTQNILIANVANPKFVLPGQPLPSQNDPSAENATVWLAPGESAKITLRVYDPNKYNNINVVDGNPETPTNPDHYVIDPLFLPTTETSLGSVTPVVRQQSVDSADVQAMAPGAPPPAPPVVTPLTGSVPPVAARTAVTLAFVQQPSNVTAGNPMAPAVSVVVRDQYGALLDGASVALYLSSNPGNASLAGAVATSGSPVGSGIVVFPALAVSAAGTGFTLAATAGTALPAVSGAFNVAPSAPVCDPLVVTTTADTNLCGSLRFAITTANGSAGTVRFAVAEPVPHVFAPATPLPEVGSGVVIDGTTDPDYLLGGSQPVIQISGASMLPAGSVGLALTGTGSTVKGIEFNGFIAGPSYTGAGVLLGGGGGHTIQASHFGMIAGNYTGIQVSSPSNLIGGSAPGQGNSIGGAGQDQGIRVSSGTGNRIEGNLIGNNGLTALGNGAGVRIEGATATIVGGASPGSRNVISGNTVGVLLVGGTGTEIRGNFIGLGTDGIAALPNNEGVTAYDAVSDTVIQANWISGNSQWGIDLQHSGALSPVTNTQIRANTIGLNILNDALANGAGGVRLNQAPGTVIEGGNVISGNYSGVEPATVGGPGILVSGSVVPVPTIRGNYIGTGPTGMMARPNRFEGIVLAGPALVGGGQPGEGNLISGNGNAGISAGAGVVVLAGSDGAVISGNTIGLNAAGAALGNGYSGITVFNGASNITIGGTNAAERNVISGNPHSGIAIYEVGGTPPSNVTVQGNAIGTDATGTAVVGNGSWGIFVTGGVNITIGGQAAGAGNIIANNNAGGVDVGPGSAAVSILSNSIYANGGLGIDVDPAGVSAAPTLSSITPTGFNYSIPGGPGPYTLEVFTSPSCDPSGYGEGRTLVGIFAAATPSGTISASFPGGSLITLTATDASGTSEFSNCVAVPAAPIAATVTLSGFSAVYDGTPKSIGYTTNPTGLLVTSTYNGSTAPTAIGAYSVVATVATPGYSGSTTATFTIASTLSTGGGGGNPYGPLKCGPGVFANGFGVSPSNESLWNAKLLCSDGIHPANFGNTDTYPYNTADNNMACPAGQVMVGFSGRHGPISWAPTADFVIAIAPRCQSPAGGPITEPFSAAPGYAGGLPFSIDCPAGQAVTGVVGGAGSVVDSIALVCSAIPPPGPQITSALPSTVAAFQYITLEGSSLPAVSRTDILFSQGGPEFAADYAWTIGASRVIARVPTGVLAVGAATVRLQNPAGTVTTNSVPITISSQPGAPVLHAVYDACFGGSATTTLNASQQFMIEAAGTGTNGTEFRWSSGVSSIQHFSAYATSGPTGRVGICANLPAGVTPGIWTLSIRSYTGAWTTGTSIVIQ